MRVIIAIIVIITGIALIVTGIIPSQLTTYAPDPVTGKFVPAPFEGGELYLIYKLSHG